MSENINAETNVAPDRASQGTSFSGSQHSDSGAAPTASSARRIDGAHPSPSKSETPFAAAPPSVAGIPQLSANTATADPGSQQPHPRNLGTDQQLLLQASQIADHLRHQLAEIDRRENMVNSQLSQLDRERRTFRLWIAEQEESIQERQEKQDRREVQLLAYTKASEALAGDLEQQERQLLLTREELAARQASLKEDVERDLERDRRTLKQQIEALADERARMNKQLNEAQVERQRALDEVQKLLSAERETMARHQIAERDKMETSLRLEREAWLTQRQTEEEEWTERRISLQTDVAATQQELERVREQLSAEREQLETQLEQERAVLENRMRFQQDHLRKTMQDLETRQLEFRREEQLARNRIQQDDELLRLRCVQLENYAAPFEEREASVERQRKLLEESQRTQRETLDRERERLRRERDTWEEERAAQRAEIRRQQDMLTLHAENLEGRRTRLDQLRAELEQTHRKTLVMRMVVEEACAQLAQSAGVEIARQRIEEARDGLAGHDQQLKAAAAQQRRELDEAQMLLQVQRQELQNERQTLSLTMNQRDDQFRVQAQRLREEAEAIEAREAVWTTAQERWIREKLEAETIIRDILQQLSEQATQFAKGSPVTAKPTRPHSASTLGGPHHPAMDQATAQTRTATQSRESRG